MQQLIYTSAPKLLDAGKTGFGTLARSKALSELLVSYLERISSFDRQAGVAAVYYYTTYHTGSALYHIFSRVGECGTDYTGRTNHLAHHFVIEQGSAEASALQHHYSPAGLMLALLPKWRTTYTHDAGYVADENAPLTSRISSHLWQQLTNREDAARWLACAPYNEGCCLSLDVVAHEQQCLQLFDEALGARAHRGWGVAFSTARVSNLSLNSAPFVCIDARQKAAGITPPLGYPVLELNSTLPKPPEPAPLSPKPVYVDTAETPYMETPADVSAPPPPMAPFSPLYEPPPPVEQPKVINVLNDKDNVSQAQPARYVSILGVGIILGVILSSTLGKTSPAEKTPPPSTPVPPTVNTSDTPPIEDKDNKGGENKKSKPKENTPPVTQPPVENPPSKTPDDSKAHADDGKTSKDTSSDSKASDTADPNTAQSSSGDNETAIKVPEDVYTEIDPQDIEKPLVLHECEILKVEWEGAKPSITIKKIVRLEEQVAKLLKKELHEVYLIKEGEKERIEDKKEVDIKEDKEISGTIQLGEDSQIKRIIEAEKQKKNAEKEYEKAKEELVKCSSEKRVESGNTKAREGTYDIIADFDNIRLKFEKLREAIDKYKKICRTYPNESLEDARKEAEKKYKQNARLILKPQKKGIVVELEYNFHVNNNESE